MYYVNYFSIIYALGLSSEKKTNIQIAMNWMRIYVLPKKKKKKTIFNSATDIQHCNLLPPSVYNPMFDTRVINV